MRDRRLFAAGRIAPVCRVCRIEVSPGRARYSLDGWGTIVCERCGPDGDPVSIEHIRADLIDQLYHMTTHPGAVDEAREIAALIRACDRVIKRRRAAEEAA